VLVLVQARLLPVQVQVPVPVLARLLPVLAPVQALLAPVQALLAPVQVLPVLLLALGPNPPMGRRQEPTGPNCQSKTLTSQN
jgi:hypothetical protein